MTNQPGEMSPTVWRRVSGVLLRHAVLGAFFAGVAHFADDAPWIPTLPVLVAFAIGIAPATEWYRWGGGHTASAARVRMKRFANAVAVASLFGVAMGIGNHYHLGQPWPTAIGQTMAIALVIMTPLFYLITRVSRRRGRAR